jgi:hypothetical protein
VIRQGCVPLVLYPRAPSRRENPPMTDEFALSDLLKRERIEACAR